MFGHVCRSAAGITARGIPDNACGITAPPEQEEKLLETLLASNIAAAILLSVEHSDTVRHWLKTPLFRSWKWGDARRPD